MIQLCRHILAGNRQCSQPAANRTLFCRHHRGVRTWKRRGAPGLDSETWETTHLPPRLRHSSKPLPRRSDPEPYHALLSWIHAQLFGCEPFLPASARSSTT